MCNGGLEVLHRQAVGGKWEAKNVFARTEEHDPIQSVVSTWLRKRVM
jgi:hypothetical protein